MACMRNVKWAVMCSSEVGAQCRSLSHLSISEKFIFVSPNTRQAAAGIEGAHSLTYWFPDSVKSSAQDFLSHSFIKTSKLNLFIYLSCTFVTVIFISFCIAQHLDLLFLIYILRCLQQYSRQTEGIAHTVLSTIVLFLLNVGRTCDYSWYKPFNGISWGLKALHLILKRDQVT